MQYNTEVRRSQPFYRTLSVSHQSVALFELAV